MTAIERGCDSAFEGVTAKVAVNMPNIDVNTPTSDSVVVVFTKFNYSVPP
jgi:hypothetical protein